MIRNAFLLPPPLILPHVDFAVYRDLNTYFIFRYIFYKLNVRILSVMSKTICRCNRQMKSHDGTFVSKISLIRVLSQENDMHTKCISALSVESSFLGSEVFH